MPTCTGSSCAPLAHKHLHAAFLEIVPLIETHARVWSRHVWCPSRREDFVSEVVALAWKWFLRASQQGKDATAFAGALAALAVKAVRSGRRLCGQERAGDVMSPYTQKRHGFRTESLPCSLARPREALYGDPRGQDKHDAFEQRLRDNTRTPVAEQAAFRVDFGEWLLTLPERGRRVVGELAAGQGTFDVASGLGVSPGRVSQMRRELHDGWLRFCGDLA